MNVNISDKLPRKFAKPQVKTIKVNTDRGLQPIPLKDSQDFTTQISEAEKKPLKSATQEPKRKDSRQVKVERLEAEVNLLATERSSLHSII